MAPIPVRKDKTPYIGCRVLDGRTSEHDWEAGKLVPIAELARSVNPKKGFLVTANNMQTSDHAKYDHGSGIMSPARAQRLTEMIEEGIYADKKFTVDDMVDMQQDVIDIVARKQVPSMIKAANSVKAELTPDEREDLATMISLLDGWQGSMDKDNIAASVYSYTFSFLGKSLFHAFEPNSEKNRLDFVDN